MDDRLDGLPIAAAAARLGVSDKTIRRRIKAGALRAHKVYTDQGYEWRVDLDQPAIVAVAQSPDHRDSDLDIAQLRRELAETRDRLAAVEAWLSTRIGPPVPVVLPREVIENAPSTQVGTVVNMVDNEAVPGIVARVRAWWRGEDA